MAIIFAENEQAKGGLSKFRVDEEKLTDANKEAFNKLKESGKIITAEEEIGSKPTDSKIEVQGGNALLSEIDKTTVDEQNDAGGGSKKKDKGTIYLNKKK